MKFWDNLSHESIILDFEDNFKCLVWKIIFAFLQQ